ncbi:MAG: hypothetical protein IPK66_06845 [Rhodospirillales bacterium]|nr:hypothetical protein [Rhodospirillales bacterium]
MRPALSAVCVLALLTMATHAIAAPAVASPGKAIGAEERYHACMDQVASDARAALASANAWREAGGGDAATHCAMAAEMALGRFSDAADGLERLAREGNGSALLRASLWGQAAHAHLAADQFEQAEAAAGQGLDLEPGNATLLVLQARALAGERRLGDAIISLNQAIAADPSLSDAYVFRASAFRQRREYDRAAADLEVALKLSPIQPEALLERGILRRLTGDDVGARADWDALIASAPKTEAAESARINLERMDGGG